MLGVWSCSSEENKSEENKTEINKSALGETFEYLEKLETGVPFADVEKAFAKNKMFYSGSKTEITFSFDEGNVSHKVFVELDDNETAKEIHAELDFNEDFEKWNKIYHELMEILNNRHGASTEKDLKKLTWKVDDKQYTLNTEEDVVFYTIQ